MPEKTVPETERTRPVATATLDAPLVDVPVPGGARGLRVPHRPQAVPAARREFVDDVTERLSRARRHRTGASETAETVEDVVAEAAVVVSELLGNAVRHAQELPEGGILLRWQVRGDVVVVEITDGGGPTRVRPARPTAFSSHGRGLRIVGVLARDWGVREGPDGRRTVWASLDGTAARSASNG